MANCVPRGVPIARGDRVGRRGCGERGALGAGPLQFLGWALVCVVLILAARWGLDRLAAWRGARQATKLHEIQGALGRYDITAATRLLQQVDPAQRGWEWRLLQRRARARREVLAAGPEDVREEQPAGGPWSALAFINHEVVAMGSRDGSISMLNARSRTLLGRLLSGLPAVSSLAVDGRGLWLAAAGGAPRVVLFELSTGERREILSRDSAGPRGGVRAVAFSPTGLLLASGADDGRVTLHDVARGGLLLDTRLPVGVTRLLFVDDGQALVALDQQGELHCLSLSDGRVRWHGHLPLPPRDLALSPDGRWLATGDVVASIREGAASAGGGVRLWRADDGSPVAELVACDGTGDDDRAGPGAGVGAVEAAVDPAEVGLDPGAPAVTALAFSPDGRRLACAQDNGELVLWDPNGPLELLQLPLDERSAVASGRQGEAVVLAALAFSPDGRLLVGVGSRPQGVASGERGVALGEAQDVLLVWDAGE